MHLFLTTVLPFLAHSHPSAAAFLTCRRHNFHASIIPEFLSSEERVKSFCGARQQNEITTSWTSRNIRYTKLHILFVQTPLMQFSPSLVLFEDDCVESILKSLLETKYFTRTLQRFTVDCALTNDILQALSKVQSLTKLDLLGRLNTHLEMIINSVPSLETLAIENAKDLDPTDAIRISSPPPPVTKTLRSLILRDVDPLFATQFVPNFPNLRKLELSTLNESQELDLLPLSSSLPLLTDLDLKRYNLKNTESLKNLFHLSLLRFAWCQISDLSFLTQANNLPHLTELLFKKCEGLSTSSFASLVHTPKLHVLTLCSTDFNSGCLQYLEDLVHLRELDLSYTRIVGDSRVLKTLMQNLFQLEELNVSGCRIGDQGAIVGAIYSTHSRLRYLNFSECGLVDDDLNGIEALKNTLEVLDLGGNENLTNEGLRNFNDLVKLKKLNLRFCHGISDLSPLKDCMKLEALYVSSCNGLNDDSFKVFSEEPNSFPNLHVLELSRCSQLTGKVFEHLSKNNHLVHQLKELNVRRLSKIVLSSTTARNNICQFKGLRRLVGFLSKSESDQNEIKSELMKQLRNLEDINWYN